MEFATFKVEDGRSLDRVGASSLCEEEEEDDDDDWESFKRSSVHACCPGSPRSLGPLVNGRYREPMRYRTIDDVLRWSYMLVLPSISSSVFVVMCCRRKSHGGSKRCQSDKLKTNRRSSMISDGTALLRACWI